MPSNIEHLDENEIRLRSFIKGAHNEVSVFSEASAMYRCSQHGCVLFLVIVTIAVIVLWRHIDVANKIYGHSG